MVKEQIQRLWQCLLGKVNLWAKSLADPSEKGDATRIQIREQTLLVKPIGQLSLVRGYLMMRERCQSATEDELCDRINRINWAVDDSMWHGVLMNPNGRVMSGRGTVNRACEFIAHLGGAQLDTAETSRLLEQIHGKEWEQRKLPAPVAQNLSGRFKPAGTSNRPGTNPPPSFHTF